MSDTSASAASSPIDVTTINNAVLFCQDSMTLLASGRSKLNPLATNPGFYEMCDAISQLQNSILDLLNWAAQVNARLVESATD